MEVMSVRNIFIFLFCICNGISNYAQQSLPLFEMSDMLYQGAFRLPASNYGNSDLNYAEGPIEYNSTNHSLFIVGHSYQQAIAEFSIPDLVDGPLDQLNFGTNLQPFASHLGAAVCGNTQNIDRVGGMKMVSGRLLVNAYEYYDADGAVTHTTLAIENPSDLTNSAVKGYFELAGGAGHTAGWISEIPQVWQGLLGGTHITGQSSGIPIISRTSVGPSAFAFSPAGALSDCEDPGIPTVRLLDFSLGEPLSSDLYNGSGENDIWTHLSRATYGLIVPGTRTYLTVGFSGGHQSGVCYKCTQDNDNLCGGYCAPEAADYAQYYWLWDLNDLLAVKNGEMESYDVTPYDYGPWSSAFDNGLREIGGGAFDAENGILYLTIQRADTEQGPYSNPPVIVAYQIASPGCVSCCESAVFLSTPDVSSGVHIYSQDFVKSDAVLDNIQNIIWTVSEYAEMLPQFEVKLGSDLTVEIGFCPE